MIRSPLRGATVLAFLGLALSACDGPAPRAEPTAEPVPMATDLEGDTLANRDDDRPAADETPAGPAGAADYRLTREAVQRFAEASKGLRRLAERDPGPMRRLHMQEEARRSASPEETTARLEAEPAVREAIEAAGMSAHEYTLVGITLSEAILVQQALAQGSIDRAPPGILEENVDFVREHRDEINRLLGEAARDP